MTGFSRWHLGSKGAAAVDFAFAAPIALTMMIGILQLGTLFQANAGLKQAVESGARFATLYPNPSDSAIIAKASASQYGLVSSRITGPSIVHGTTGGAKYIELTMSYAVPINFIFFQTSAVTLSHTRRAYQP